jgi:hypothetical protein
MLDFNRANLSAAPISVAINDLIEAVEPPEENSRQYLGASAVGSECLRKIQFDWMVDPVHSNRTRDIFRRGHLFEELTRQHLIRAGFQFAPDDRLGFRAADGLFRGHADGILVAGPALPDVGYRAIWEHTAIFTAVNCNTMERLHLLHPFDAARAQMWSDRAVTVIKATVAGELLPRAYGDPTDWRCRLCGHRERCWK